MVSFPRWHYSGTLSSKISECLFSSSAEFRGPGVHHNFDDSDGAYEEGEKGGKPFGIGGYRGRIIFLGDGSEVLTDSDDTEMFDQEDKDLDSQVSKASASSEPEGESASKTGDENKSAGESSSKPAASTETGEASKSEAESKKEA
jgi:protein phosphatase PTC2/3